MNNLNFKNKIFEITSTDVFNKIALQIFHHQCKNNNIYRKYINHLSIDVKKIKHYTHIPFLPIDFFRNHRVVTGRRKNQIIFESSQTTGAIASKHYVTDRTVYNISMIKAFQYFYGNIKDYCIIALLPSYLEREGSSLVYMIKELMKYSNRESGFYLNNKKDLVKKLQKLSDAKQKTLLIGVSFALLDFAEQYKLPISNTIIMETGGMKGKKKEITRQEFHQILCEIFNVKNIHSEYGMTELLSQAYSKGNGIFKCPPWMKVLIREINAPFTITKNNQIGGINIIDLANYNSCSFIATQDVGKLNKNESFEVLGRFDNSDMRGCNLMVS